MPARSVAVVGEACRASAPWWLPSPLPHRRAGGPPGGRSVACRAGARPERAWFLCPGRGGFGVAEGLGRRPQPVGQLGGRVLTGKLALGCEPAELTSHVAAGGVGFLDRPPQHGPVLACREPCVDGVRQLAPPPPRPRLRGLGAWRRPCLAGAVRCLRPAAVRARRVCDLRRRPEA